MLRLVNGYCCDDCQEADRVLLHPPRVPSLGQLSDGFNGADLRNVCTEAGLFAIRDERNAVLTEDFSKAVRKVREAKMLETTIDYEKV